jgi:ribosomal protein S12 methylthiotransferase
LKLSENVFIYNLGCPKNLVDAEIMAGILKEAGYALKALPEEADVIIVNTCAFIDEAREESIDAILQMARFKEAGCRKLVVSGCMAQQYAADLAKDLPEVDAFVGIDEIARIAEVIEKIPQRRQITAVSPPGAEYPEGSPRALAQSPGSAYIKVSEGCQNRCNYCMIPFIRGDLRSRPVEFIAREAEDLAQKGVKEINLIAQDITNYGLDLAGGPMLADLLAALERVAGIEWIRLLYTYPSSITDEMLHQIAESHKILPYIDMPLQHINDRMLAAMGRRYGRADIERLLERIRSILPRAVLRTSLIVGFPGETEAHFGELYEFVRSTGFDRLGCFIYSREEGTPAAEYPGQVEPEEKKRRFGMIMEVQRQIAARKNKALVGQVRQAIIEGYSEETELLLSARIDSQAPDVDGITYINKGDSEAGRIERVLITEAFDYDLLGEIVED